MYNLGRAVLRARAHSQAAVVQAQARLRRIFGCISIPNWNYRMQNVNPSKNLWSVCSTSGLGTS